MRQSAFQHTLMCQSKEKLGFINGGRAKKKIKKKWKQDELYKF